MDGFAIALILLPICIVCTVVSEKFRPYKPVQIIHDTAPAVVKLQDRIHKEKT